MNIIPDFKHEFDVAPHFAGKVWAYVPVTSGSMIGVAVANEPGYCPIPKGIACFQTWEAAQAAADHANREYLHLPEDAAMQIVTSSMFPTKKRSV